MTREWKIGMAALALTLILAALMVGVGLAVSLTMTKPPPRIELADLLADWKKNPVGTERRYNGLPVRVTGCHLFHYGKNRHGDHYVILTASPKPGVGESDLQAFVQSADAYKSVGRFDLGSRVTAEVIFDQGADGKPRSNLVRLLAPGE